MAVTTGRFQLSPRKNSLTIRALKWNGFQEVIGSWSEAVSNQRTDDHLLEMSSMGLLSPLELELCAHQVLFKSDSETVKVSGGLGRGAGSLLLDMVFQCYFYFRSV